MRTKGRKRTILLALTSTHHGFYRGAARYAAEHDWHIVADIIYDATIPVGWRGDGILSFVGHWDDLAKYVTSAGVPVVEISSVRKDLGLPSVMEDNDAIGRLGGEHLLERNLKNFAWAPFSDDAVNEERFRGFAASAVGVLLEEGIGCKLPGLAAGGTEEIAVDVIGDADRFDVIVQTLIETMMTRNIVLLAAFFL